MLKWHCMNTTDNYFSCELWDIFSSDKFISSQRYAKFSAKQSWYKVLTILHKPSFHSPGFCVLWVLRSFQANLRKMLQIKMQTHGLAGFWSTSSNDSFGNELNIYCHLICTYSFSPFCENQVEHSRVAFWYWWKVCSQNFTNRGVTCLYAQHTHTLFPLEIKCALQAGNAAARI